MMIAGRIRKLSIMFAFMMLIMIGISAKGAKAQPICPGPGAAFPIGIVNLNVNAIAADFIASDLYIAELLADGTIVGGVDWLLSSIFSFANPLGPIFPNIVIGANGLTVNGSLLNTTITGSQLISNYNQKDGRRTYVEVGNSARGICAFDRVGILGGFPQECLDNLDCVPSQNFCLGNGTCSISGAPCTDDFDCAVCLSARSPANLIVEVHVEVLDENCQEVCNFCDAYTPLDKHVYDLSDPVRNRDGTPASTCASGVINGREGFLTVTAVKDCIESVSHQARDFNYLFGDMTLLDPRIDVTYGENLQTRLAFSNRGTCSINGQECITGSFLGSIVPIDPCPGDVCEGSIEGFCNTDNGDQCYTDADCEEQFPGQGVPCVSTPVGPPQFGTCAETGFDCGILDPCQFGCGDYTGLGGTCELFAPGNCNDIVGCSLSDATCDAFFACTSFNFCVLDGSGCPGHCLDGDLGCELVSHVPQFLRRDFSILPAAQGGTLVAGADLVKKAFVDNYGTPGDGFRYRVDPGLVEYAEGIFGENEDAGSCGEQIVCYDRVGVNDVLPLIDPPNPIVSPTPPPPTPTPTPGPPTPTPTVTPTPPPVTPTAPPSFQPKQGSSGKCSSLAGGAPVQLGTALANILIPLVPAFAIGFRMIRRKRKDQK